MKGNLSMWGALRCAQSDKLAEHYYEMGIGSMVKGYPVFNLER